MKRDHGLPPGDAARLAGVSPDYLRKLDSELRPERLPNGHRRYSVAVVERFAAKRAAARRG